MNNVTTLGIDLAKHVFQLHGMDRTGKCVLKKRLSREKLMPFIMNLPACVIGIEACGGSHEWARKFKQAGHEVKMMAPQFVKPYVKSNKNDANDAAGIAEAVTRPAMRFVPIKTLEQQDLQLVHTVRQLQIKQRTALGNQIRGLLNEYGIILAKGIAAVRNNLSFIIEDAGNALTDKARALFNGLNTQFKAIDKQIGEYESEIERNAKTDERCQRLMKIEGVGPITATAIVAAIGNGHEFKRGREFSAWIGLVPRQHSSGNKVRLMGISKRGDGYLRTLLIHGARAVVRTCENKNDGKSQWVARKKSVCGENKAAVALANKNARIIWAVLSSGEAYQPAEEEKESIAIAA